MLNTVAYVTLWGWYCSQKAPWNEIALSESGENFAIYFLKSSYRITHKKIDAIVQCPFKRRFLHVYHYF